IRVLIADDHTIVRSGIRLLMESQADIEVVGEALNGEEAVKMVSDLQPDVVLMDISMPNLDGMEATRRIVEQWSQVKVLVLTMHRAEEYFFEMLKAGASGYILKAAETSELINAVRVVARGEIYLYPSMAQKLVKDYLNLVEGDHEQDTPLSPREEQILELLVDGYTNSEIADKLVLSASTVHTHRYNIMNKLGLTSRHELIQYARERGLLGD
ncbi:MAG: response regulator transcription factor, partial [Anaerolineales bacterium]